MGSTATAPIRLRDLVLPREHGSWSFVLEPLALGLLAAPSWPGAVLALATLAAFFARRPLQLTRVSGRDPRRELAWHTLAALALLALSAAALALHRSGPAPWIPLGVALLPAALFLHFDRQGEGRALAAELAGVGAFSLLPVALALLAGRPALPAAALGALMLVRSVPTVLTLRAVLRRRKGQPESRSAPLVAALLGASAVAALTAAGHLPPLAPIAAVVLLGRTIWWLSPRAPAWRAAQFGICESALGALFVLALGLAARG